MSSGSIDIEKSALDANQYIIGLELKDRKE